MVVNDKCVETINVMITISVMINIVIEFPNKIQKYLTDFNRKISVILVGSNLQQIYLRFSTHKNININYIWIRFSA